MCFSEKTTVITSFNNSYTLLKTQLKQHCVVVFSKTLYKNKVITLENRLRSSLEGVLLNF